MQAPHGRHIALTADALVAAVTVTTALVASACRCTGRHRTGRYCSAMVVINRRLAANYTGHYSTGGDCNSHHGTGRYSRPLTGRYYIGRSLVATALVAKPVAFEARESNFVAQFSNPACRHIG